MNKLAHFAHFLKGFSGLFTKPGYDSFKKIVESMVRLPDHTQADLASGTGKTLRQIQYFFGKAKWSPFRLNQARLAWLRNRMEFRDRTGDDVILDGSVIKKDKDAKFGELASFMYSNLAKGVVNGLMILGAGIRTDEGQSFLLDVRIFVKHQWKSEWQAWRYFAGHIAKITKGRLWILDRGFRNQYFLAHILKLKRLFLVRVSLSLNVMLPATDEGVVRKGGRKPGRLKGFHGHSLSSVKKQIADHEPVLCENGRLWIISHAIVSAWRAEIKKECTVIVFHRDGFRNPLVLVYSQPEADIKLALELVGRYIGRWSIETLFKESKSWFCFGDFRVTGREAVYRCLYLSILTHSLLTVLMKIIKKIPLLHNLISFILRKSRNITDCVIIGLKLFYESVSLICLTPPKWLDLKTKRTLMAYFL